MMVSQRPQPQQLVLWVVVLCCVGPLLCSAQIMDVPVGKGEIGSTAEKVEQSEEEVAVDEEQDVNDLAGKNKKADETVAKDTQDDPPPLSLWGIIKNWIGLSPENEPRPTNEEMQNFKANYRLLEDESERLEREWADKEPIPAQMKDEVIETIDVDDLATTSTFDDLSSQRLRIWTTAPAAVGFPVIFSAVLTDTPSTETRYEWHFTGTNNNPCISKGKKLSLCTTKAVDQTWLEAGTYTVTVRVWRPDWEKVLSHSIRIKITDEHPFQVVQRKEVRALSANKWQELVDGFHYLKSIGVHDHLTWAHKAASGTKKVNYPTTIHRSPSFLPWHRASLAVTERALQVATKDSRFAMPYWDWTIEAGSSASEANSGLWTDRYFGPFGKKGFKYIVESGPFCSLPSDTCDGRWALLPSLNGPALIREHPTDTGLHFPTSADVKSILRHKVYDVPPFNENSKSFRNDLEGFMKHNSHNSVHDWVGGSMTPMTSPNDPTFYFHHANVDRVWAYWQNMHDCYEGCYRPATHEKGITTTTNGAVLTDNGEWHLPGQHWEDFLHPWHVRIADVADRASTFRYARYDFEISN